MFRFFLFIGIALCSFSLQAQSLYDGVQLSLNSPDGVYQKGDTVKVTAHKCFENNDTLLMQVVSYDKVLSEQEITLSCREQTIYSMVAEDPVSIMVKVSPIDNPKTSASIGWLVSPSAFLPGFSTPDDLKDFWNKELARMRGQKPEVQVFPSVGVNEADKQMFVCYKFEINMPEGNPCRGYVAYPRDAAPASLPIYLFVHSAGVSKPWNHDSAEKVISLAGKGYLAVDINAHGFLSDQPKEYYDALEAGELKNYAGRDFTGASDYYFHNMYLRDIRGLDYITTLPVWDGRRILVHGESQGGGQALALSGIDDRITHCVAIVPALTDMGAILDGRKCGWPGWANKKNAVTELGPSVLAYHDGAVLISLFNGNLYVEAGNIDLACDPAAVSAGFNNAASAKTREIVYYPWRTHTTSGMEPGARERWKQEVLTKRDAFFESVFSE